MIDSIKEYLKKKLTFKQFFLARRVALWFLSIGIRGNLNKLGRLCKTDKVLLHNFTPHYMFHFRKFRFKRIRMLEIGVGGDENPFKGGNSLWMWKKYFPFGQIFAVDIHDKSSLQESRIRIFQGSQADEAFLKSIESETGELDIIIDDGSHMNDHVIETFRIMFPKLKNGGIYVIEDTQTSYYKDYGGDSVNLNVLGTSMGFFKSLVDSLNYREFEIPNYEPTYYDKNIVSMHFYYNLVIIHKGNNDEKSNT